MVGKFFVIASLSMLFGCAAGPGTLPADPEAQLTEADRRLQAGERSEALHLYGLVLDQDDRRTDAYVGIGRIHADRNDPIRSTIAYAMAYQYGDRRPEVLWSLGRAHHRAGRLDRAVELYRMLLDKLPDRTDVRLNLIAAHLQAGWLDPALVEAEAAVKQAPRSSPARVALAEVHGAAGRHREALRQYKRIAGSGPMALPVLSNAADAALRAGAYGRAAEWLGALVADRPTERSLVRLGYAWFRLGHDREALSAYRRALQIDEESTAALNGLGVVTIRQFEADGGRDPVLRQTALKWLVRSVVLDPDQPNVQHLIDR
ncbi:MAG: tetratricopeptide repeat protein, partial [Candidatus Competibacterales bacterium]|nr:tetratricopeptide repeat protein [Candidatus Competibacterales bacterium]